MDAISQTIFSFKSIFLNENVWIPIKIWLKFVPKGPINNIPAFVQIMAWCRPGDKPLSEVMMVHLPTHICVSRPQWVNPSIHPMYQVRDHPGILVSRLIQPVALTNMQTKFAKRWPIIYINYTVEQTKQCIVQIEIFLEPLVIPAWTFLEICSTPMHMISNEFQVGFGKRSQSLHGPCDLKFSTAILTKYHNQSFTLKQQKNMFCPQSVVSALTHWVCQLTAVLTTLGY